MPQSHVKIRNFDKRLMLAGGRDIAEPGFLRRATGAAGLRTYSLQSRPGSTLLYPNQNAHSIGEYEGNFYYGVGTNLYSGSSLLTGGFSGQRMSFNSMPPQIGLANYLFVNDGSHMVKIDPNNNVTNWGIQPPSNGLVVTAGTNKSLLIDQMDTSGHTIFNPVGRVVTTQGDTTYEEDDLGIDADLLVLFKAQTAWSITKSVGGPGFIDLSQYSDGTYSLPSDLITLYVYVVGFPVVKAIKIQFNCGPVVSVSSSKKGVFNNRYECVVSFVDTPTLLNSTLDNPQRLTNYINNRKSSGKLGIDYDVATAVIQGTWVQLQLPKAVFRYFPGVIGNSWEHVTQWRIGNAAMDQQTKDYANSATGALGHAVNGVAFAILGMEGGYPQFGNYQYVTTFLDSHTGSRSNPQGSGTVIASGVSGINPALVENLVVQPADLSLIPTSTDPQVNARELWRTSSGGSTFAFLDVIPDNTTTSYVDVTADIPTPITINTFQTGHVYPLGYLLDGGNGYYFKVVTAGTSGVVTPNWQVPTGLYRFIWKSTTQYYQTDWVYYPPTRQSYIASADVIGTAPPNAPWTLAPLSQSGTAAFQINGINQLPLLGTVPNLTTPIELQLDNIPPQPTFSDAVGPWQGMMIWTRDSAPSANGRVYWSPVGRPESVAAYDDIGNGNDVCQKLVLYDDGLFLFTSKNVYEGILVPAATEGDDPSIQFIQLGAAIGTTLPFTVQPTPMGILYAVTGDCVYQLRRGGSNPFALDTIGPVLRGQTVGPYGPFNPVWACYARGEYFISDTTDQTYACLLNVPEGLAITSVPGTWRALGFPINAMIYPQDKKHIQASFYAGIYQFEVAGVFQDGTTAIPFDIEIPAINVNESADTLVQRLFIDYNSYDIINVNLLFDNNTVNFTVLPWTSPAGSRHIVELPVQQSGLIIGVQITADLSTGLLELYGVEMDITS